MTRYQTLAALRTAWSADLDTEREVWRETLRELGFESEAAARVLAMLDALNRDRLARMFDEIRTAIEDDAAMPRTVH